MSSFGDDDLPQAPASGSGGGNTPDPSDLVRRTFWIGKDVDERLRKEALEACTSEGELVREALRLYFDLE